MPPLLLIILLGLLSSCTLLAPPWDQPVMNRHECTDCHTSHQPATDAARQAAPDELASICVQCHDIGTNHHPFGMMPLRKTFFNPYVNYPLFNGRIECLTCHEPHGGPDRIERPMLLRGGPYRDRRQICFNCHTDDAYREIYPHQMIEASGAITTIDGRPSCLICHAVMPDPQKDRTADVRLRADVGFICWRCHPPSHASFIDGHFLKVPQDSTLEAMQNAERTMGIILPIIPRNRVTCSTCHNPHQAGVILDDAARKGADAPKKLRMPKGRVCEACHPGR